MAFNKHLRLSWKLENSGKMVTVEIDHGHTATNLGHFCDMKKFLMLHAQEDSDGVFIISSPEIFTKCCEMAGIPC